MADKKSTDVDDVWDDWKDAVTMTASEIEKWLDTDESKEVGDKSGGGESTGHESGRKIVKILGKKKADLTDADVQWMHKVVGYVHRHAAQRPDKSADELKTSHWRYSLMNWGHDPLK